MSAVKKEYGDKKGESVFYAMRNSGKIRGVDPESKPKQRGLRHVKIGGR